MCETLLELQDPPKNNSHVGQEREGNVGVGDLTDSAQAVNAKT